MDPVQSMRAVARDQTTDQIIKILHRVSTRLQPIYEHLLMWKAACLQEINSTLRSF